MKLIEKGVAAAAAGSEEDGTAQMGPEKNEGPAAAAGKETGREEGGCCRQGER